MSTNSLKPVDSVVSEIMAAAKTKIGEALIERAAVINSAFDDAYGSCLGGHYASGMECVAEALKNLDDLLEYAGDVMSTADASSWEYVRDALGSVILDKAPLQQSIVDEYKIRITRYVSPTFGDHPKHYLVEENGITIESWNNQAFLRSSRSGKLISATLDTLGVSYYWDKHHFRWVMRL